MKTALTYLSFAACLWLQSCVAVWNGHKVRREALTGFVPNLTSQDEVAAALGPPEDIIFRSAERVTVYVYRSIVSVQLALPLPISPGRSRQRGFTLNVMFKNGIYRGYELVELKQKLFWR